jgi:hypoxanthine phosphoribosyltransferase
MSSGTTVLYSASRLAAQVARMGRAISRDHAGKTLDVVVMLENAFIFGADLLRHITVPVSCRFVRTETRDVKVGGFDRKEIFFSDEPNLRGRDVLVVDAVLHSGVTLDFLAKRLMESRPHSLRVAVLIDKPQERCLDFAPDYFGFRAASKYLVGYGLPDADGHQRNLPYVGVLGPAPARGARKAKRAPGKRARKAR